MSIFSLGSDPGTAIASYLADSKNEQTQATKWARRNAQVQADISYFQAQAPKLTTADALMKDYRSLKIVLGAYNVSDLLSYPALTRQLLTQDPNATSSTARKIGNPAYQKFAAAFNQFQDKPLSNSSTVSTIVNNYVTNAYEAAQNTSTPGLQNALAFTRAAPQITSIAQLMSNKPALTVAVGQTGIDFNTYAAMNYDQQVSLLTKKIKVADFQNPAKVTKMAEQYLIQAVGDPTKWNATSANTTTMLSLFGGSSTTSILSLFGAGGTPTSTGSSNSTMSLFA